MAHVQLHHSKGSGRLIVDGVDITDHVLADGFAIEMPDTMEGNVVVRLGLVAETFDADLPEAVLHLRESEATA